MSDKFPEIDEPPYSPERGEFYCPRCNEGERVFIQHPDDDTALVCAVDGEHYRTPVDGPWYVPEDATQETTRR